MPIGTGKYELDEVLREPDVSFCNIHQPLLCRCIKLTKNYFLGYTLEIYKRQASSHYLLITVNANSKCEQCFILSFHNNSIYAILSIVSYLPHMICSLYSLTE